MLRVVPIHIDHMRNVLKTLVRLKDLSNNYLCMVEHY